MANAKLDVEIGSFVSNINSAKSILKGLEAEMKATDAAFKATGNSEQQMANKTKTLNSQINIQKGIADQASKALEQMREAGVEPTDAAYQKMYVTLMNANAGMNTAQAELNGLGQSAKDAADGAEQLTSSVQSIGKKMSLEQVKNGIDSITKGLETAAKKAIELGKNLWDAVMDSAQKADDMATQAMVLGMNVEDYQRYKKVFDTIGELTVSEWQKAKLKIQKAISDPTQDQTDIFGLLGIQTHEGGMAGKNGWVEGKARDFEEVFWEVGKKLREKVANGELTQGEADVYANAIFGKGFAELNPMFALGQEGFMQAVEAQKVASEEAVNKMAELNDQVTKLKSDYESLKLEVMSGLAPALTTAAATLDSLLGKVLDYLHTEEGQKALADLGKAVEGLFDDLGKIDPETVVEGFTGVLNTVVEGVQWITNNTGTVIGALEAIVIGWGTLKLAGGALDILKLIQGITGLSGASTAAAAAGTAAGNSWGSAFAAAVMKAAPWLVGLYTLLNPSGTADDKIDAMWDSETGEVTEAGIAAGITENIKEDEEAWEKQKQQAQNSLEATYTTPATEQNVWQNQLSDETAWTKVSPEQFKAIQAFWDAMRENPTDFSDADWDAFESAFEGQEDLFNLVNDIMDHFALTHDEAEWPEDLPEDFFKFEAEPELPEDAGSTLQEDLNKLTLGIPVKPTLVGIPGLPGLPGIPGHANGLPFVPRDNYLALLHKGERVMPAREAASRNFSSNLYVENMHMAGGVSAAALAAEISARNRRLMVGYGA